MKKKKGMHGKKIRTELLLNIRADNILQSVAKLRGISKNRIIDELILKNLVNPIDLLKHEKRELVIQMNAIDDKIKELEDAQQ